MRIYTIGHSDLNFEDFVKALKSFNIKKLIDVRSMPGSRHVPQYNKELLAPALEERGIIYSHFPSLGGRRKSARKDDYDLVGGWKNISFRNYASYTVTDEYEQGLKELIFEGEKCKACIMCAESVPWRCHRLLISNTLSVRGVEVWHIMSENKHLPHELGRFGAAPKIVNDRVLYPAGLE